MKNLNFISLISGGKDSIYSIIIAKCYGFHLVAAAHLIPNDMGKDDTESYMYQGTGHECVPSIAGCLGVPLYQRRAEGISKIVSMQYEMDPEDEVEDLYKILEEVVDDYPGVKFVSCGAIRSDYQRHRVEKVCQRLGLRCLAFLWGENQQRLLKQIVDSKTEAILVKVAAEGLKSKHVGQSLRALQSELLRLERTCGIHPCGEGGEFETITLNSPAFQENCISILRSTVRVLTMDQYAPVCVLDVLEHKVEKIPEIQKMEFRDSFLELQEFYKSGRWIKDLIIEDSEDVLQSNVKVKEKEIKDEIYFLKGKENEKISGVEVIDCRGYILPWEVAPDPESVPFLYGGFEDGVFDRSIDIGISLATLYFMRIVFRCYPSARQVALTLTIPRTSESQKTKFFENWRKRANSSILLTANEEKIHDLQEIKIDFQSTYDINHVQCSGYGFSHPDV
eukprot:GHVP01060400.1.p1 GENE.GHVP01060400.1~~GHVP01060400.1.p1  ORF type:complete len:458 (+),score=88.70 GHVP01060400.1:25-1374(+)